jgi:hypothetical protein
MKKLIIILVAILPMSVLAQRFHGGVVGGVNVSQIEGDGAGGYRKIGLIGGAFVTTELRDKWGGLLEIRYAEKGSSIPEDYIKFRLQYIEMPVLATYDINKKIQVQAGVTVGYLFKQMQNDGNGYEDITDYDKFEIAASLGGGYRLSERLNLNVRFSFSMIPIEADNPGSVSILEASYNNVISFTGYYRLGR